MGFVAQFAVSLLAVLALAWLAGRLGLGRDVRILDEDHARLLADEVIFGFDAQDIVMDEHGKAALLRDQTGTIILVKLHGAQFSGRVLGLYSQATVRDNPGKAALEVDSGEWLFGKSTLEISDAETWAAAINAAGNAAHA